MTVGRWPWRLAPAKKRVATYLPNWAPGKMEGIELRAEALAALLGKRAALF